MKAYYESVLHNHKAFVTGKTGPYKRHFHTAVEMVITMSGSQVFSVGDESMELTAGGAGIAFPYQEHGYSLSDKNTDGEKFAFILPPEMLDTPERKYSGFLPATPFYIYKDGELEKLMGLVQPLAKETEKNTEWHEIDIDDKIWYRELIRAIILFHLEHTGIVKADKNSFDTGLLQKVMLYLDKHYEDCDFCVKSMAEELDVSYKYLSNMVSKSTGYALIDHVHNLRVSKARKMLTDTYASITDIAFESGFSSLRTFNRVFMKYTGKTPSDYRVTKGDDNL